MYQNEQSNLPKIDESRFENIFKINKTEDNGYYFYNILKTVRIDSDSLDSKYYYLHRVNRSTPYTALSHQLYKNMHLWWLICIVNDIDNPVEFIEPGSVIRVIKTQYVSSIIDTIKQQLK